MRDVRTRTSVRAYRTLEQQVLDLLALLREPGLLDATRDRRTLCAVLHLVPLVVDLVLDLVVALVVGLVVSLVASRTCRRACRRCRRTTILLACER